MKRLIFGMTLLMIAMAGQAQKKELSQARDNLKGNRNLPQTEQSMKNLLKDSANLGNKKIWLYLFDAIRKQYEQGNEKLYLKQQYDTASLVNIAHRLFLAMERFDSIDAAPDKTGKSKPEYRKKHADLLNTLRPNLYNGALFLIGKQKYDEAYNYLDTYIDCANRPMFRSYAYSEKDTVMPQAAYWAVYCGYRLADARKTLHHTYLALKDKRHIEPMLQYLATTYQLEGDTTRYRKALMEGFSRYPLNSYFFSELVNHYCATDEWTEALAVADKALKSDSLSKVFLLAKSTILLNLERYDETIKVSDRLIALDDSLAQAQLNAGLAYFNKGVAMDVRTKRTTHKHEILDMYKKALPYLEKARKQLPEQKDKWSLPLYTIYLNLNMGEEFDEIDKLIR